MRYFPQGPFLNITPIWSNGYVEDSTGLKLPVVGRWFLSPMTQETCESPQRLPDSDGTLAFQRAAIRSICKGHGQQGLCPIPTLSRGGENHQTRLNGRYAVQWTFPLDAPWDRARRVCSAKKRFDATKVRIGPLRRWSDLRVRQPLILFPVNELFEQVTQFTIFIDNQKEKYPLTP